MTFVQLTEYGSNKPFYLNLALVRRVTQEKKYTWVNYDNGFWGSPQVAVTETAEEVVARLSGAGGR